MTRDSRRFLRPEEISRIARLEIRARHIVEGFQSGLHRSPYLGQSVEFVQHREYVPGDDVRRIDWYQYYQKTHLPGLRRHELGGDDGEQEPLGATPGEVGGEDFAHVAHARRDPGHMQLSRQGRK